MKQNKNLTIKNNVGLSIENQAVSYNIMIDFLGLKF